MRLPRRHRGRDGAYQRRRRRVCRQALGDLFECEKDPINLIKVKELYEALETATDKAEDVANVLEAVVLKNA